jgi:hypothetical protein
MNIDQKTVLITGASSGIGKALSENFARDGYAVILAARSENKLEILAEDLHRRFGVTAIAATADLESASGADGLYAYVKGRGMRLSALVNNAGFGVFGEFTDAALGPQLSMMRLNMNAVVALTKLFLPDLLSTKGKVLNVASTGAFQPGPYFAVYAATKAFVLSFSEAIAAELAGTGVTVTALCPGPTATGFSGREDMHKSRLFNGKKLQDPEQVAAAGYRAMKRGQRVYVHGLMNRLMAFSVRFTPRAIVIEVVKFLSKPA